MKMDLQGLSLSEVGPQSIWDGFVMTEVAKNFQSFTTSKIPYHFKSVYKSGVPHHALKPRDY